MVTPDPPKHLTPTEAKLWPYAWTWRNDNLLDHSVVIRRLMLEARALENPTPGTCESRPYNPHHKICSDESPENIWND